MLTTADLLRPSPLAKGTAPRHLWGAQAVLESGICPCRTRTAVICQPPFRDAGKQGNVPTASCGAMTTNCGHKNRERGGLRIEVTNRSASTATSPWRLTTNKNSVMLTPCGDRVERLGRSLLHMDFFWRHAFRKSF